MVRTVQVLERAGAAGLQIEDQVFPKKCGHFDGKEVVPLEEMLAKIKAASRSSEDGDLQIVARTDARAILGLYGRDRSRRRHDRSRRRRRPSWKRRPRPRNWRRSPKPHRSPGRQRRVRRPHAGTRAAEIRRASVCCVLYANAALQAAKASYDVLRVLKSEGSLQSVADRLASFKNARELRRSQRGAWTRARRVIACRGGGHDK